MRQSYLLYVGVGHIYIAGRAEEACDGESCAKDIECGGSRKRRDASEH